MRLRDETLRQATSLVCRCCGQELPVSKFRRYPSGTYRHRILRELEERD